MLIVNHDETFLSSTLYLIDIPLGGLHGEVVWIVVGGSVSALPIHDAGLMRTDHDGHGQGTELCRYLL